MQTNSEKILDNQTRLKKTLRLVIHGRVQGVFFRDSMRREALSLGVSGWVRNRNDGTVEAAVHGDPEAINAIVHWAHLGPQYAQVVGVQMEPYHGTYNSFEVIE